MKKIVKLFIIIFVIIFFSVNVVYAGGGDGGGRDNGDEINPPTPASKSPWKDLAN